MFWRIWEGLKCVLIFVSSQEELQIAIVIDAVCVLGVCRVK